MTSLVSFFLQSLAVVLLVLTVHYFVFGEDFGSIPKASCVQSKVVHILDHKLPDCFTADTIRTWDILNSNKVPSKPILNVGMPKAGSTTLEDFFDCAGYRASHWATEKRGLVGICMRRAVENGNPPIASCNSWYRKSKSRPRPENENDRNVEALLQMDVLNSPDNCVFPQMSYLNEIHAEVPNATFILNFRDVHDWIKSLRHWSPKDKGTMASRITECHLPGLPSGTGNSTEELQFWWCQQVNRIRSFVTEHPSHTLLELDLYDNEYNAAIMSQIFQTNRSCWGHANANPTLEHGSNRAF